jgi:hypothetical protein
MCSERDSIYLKRQPLAKSPLSKSGRSPISRLETNRRNYLSPESLQSSRNLRLHDEMMIAGRMLRLGSNEKSDQERKGVYYA